MAVDCPGSGGTGKMLGPPVCNECYVVYILDNKDWYCPYCYRDDTDLHTADCGLTDSQLEDNRKFFDFITRKRNGRI